MNFFHKKIGGFLMSFSVRKFVSLGLVCAVTASVAMFGSGCSKSSGGGGKTINVWSYLTQDEATAVQKAANDWAKKTGNKVVISYHDSSEGFQKFSQAANSAKGPDMVFGIASDNVGTFATAGLVSEVPSGTINNSDYNDASVKATVLNGKTYSVPLAIESLGLFYNTDKVKTAPASWDDLITSAQQSGGLMFDASNFYDDYGFIRAFGGYVFAHSNETKDPESDIGLGNEGSVKAYGFLNDLVNKYHFMTKDVTGDIAKSNFSNGKIAYYISGPWDVSSFQKAGVHFAVAPLPTLNGKNMPTICGTQVAFVSAKSQNQSSDWDLLKSLLKSTPEPLYKIGSRIPALKSIQDSAEVKSNADVQAFIKQGSYGDPMPNIPQMNCVWDPAQKNVKLIFSGQSTPEKAASDIVSQVKQGIATQNAGK